MFVNIVSELSKINIFRYFYNEKFKKKPKMCIKFHVQHNLEKLMLSLNLFTGIKSV